VIRLAYLAQVVDRLAHQVDTDTGADLSRLTPADQAKLAATLAAATSRLEDTADLVKRAYLAARPQAGHPELTKPVNHERIHELGHEMAAAPITTT
jgi:hypothetical protein